MKLLNKTLSFFAILFILQSCEKVVDIDLEESPQQIVIEADLKEGTNDFIVAISKTTAYFETVPQEIIENAIVTLMDDGGNATSIPYKNNGQYIAEVSAEVGRTYTLLVDLDGNKFEATSFLPEPIEIVELLTVFQDGIFGDEAGYELLMRYNDPANIRNYYRVLYSVNGVLQNEASDLQVMTDDFNDGVLTKAPLLTDMFNEGDTIDLELAHIDRISYEYFNTLISIIGEGGGFGGGIAAPGNPNTNWSGGALGYFSAYSSDVETIIAK